VPQLAIIFMLLLSCYAFILPEKKRPHIAKRHWYLP